MTFTSASLTAASLFGLLAFVVLIAATVVVTIGDLTGRDVADGPPLGAAGRPAAERATVRVGR